MTTPLVDKIKAMPEAERVRLIRLSMPRMCEQYMAHIPHPVQQYYLTLRQEEAMYGGAAGGGKSDALLMAALQYVDVPGYSALLLRRTWPDLSLPGAIMDRARQWLDGTDAVPKEGGRKWVFPSGARITFGYLQYHKDVYQYQSAEFQFIGFDELTQFEHRTYNYMFSRIRRPAITCINCGGAVKKYASGWKHLANNPNCRGGVFPDPKMIEQYKPAAQDGLTLMDVPLRMRSATNPGGIGHQWVRENFIDPRTKRKNSAFVPARLTDNPSVDRESYVKNLNYLTPVDRERLLNGDWDVEEEGAVFKRHWFTTTDDVPADCRRVRYWDLAATIDGDFTVGALVALANDGRWYIEDIQRLQGTPRDVEKLVRQTAFTDGPGIPIVMEQEPGSSGVNNIDHYRRNVLVGFNFKGDRPSGSKELRAGPMSSAAEAGNCLIKTAAWNRDFLDEASLFPYGAHDDQIDSVTGGMGYLGFGRRARLIV
jgi:predicted phage terminase large subunit-like protein